MAFFEKRIDRPSRKLRRSTSLASKRFVQWRKRFGALVATDAKKLKTLEAENNRLKNLVVERDLEIEVMKEIAAKEW
jgi:putative transposase